MRLYHNAKCTKGFGRISPKGVCPRCDELRKGVKTRNYARKSPRRAIYDDKGALIKNIPTK
jgi:hypothetical protein